MTASQFDIQNGIANLNFTIDKLMQFQGLISRGRPLNDEEAAENAKLLSGCRALLGKSSDIDAVEVIDELKIHVQNLEKLAKGAAGRDGK